ncbi:MAG: carbohydrate binding family 9 domain-containing protein [Rhodothermaceae bacterium]|nr:carbohydrate binding family 9 domain-containing protein [Rhodothermaceae bacterium]
MTRNPVVEPPYGSVVHSIFLTRCMVMAYRLTLVALLFFSATPLFAQTNHDASADALRLNAVALEPGERPRVDGVLDEAIWTEAPKADGFVQTRPNPGEPASERTEVSVLYDDAALYVGFRCFVRDLSTLVARLARRDEFVGSDRVSVAFDSYNDDRTAFFFGVTAGNVEQDILMYDDTNEDSSWDAVWDGKAARFSGPDGAGYTVEMRIPFSQLRYQTGDGPEVWGLQFQRRIPTTDEMAFWAPILPEVEGFVSRFGQLDGLDVQRAPRQVEIVPYASSQLTRAPGDLDNPFYAENELQPNVGFDAKVGLTSNLTLTATINPDFGQVEADPAVVNLSQFENFFRERRPFFIEGVDIFEYGRTRTNNVSFRPTFFYSRRIGRSPSRFPSGASWVDRPEQTTIATAAKVSGKIGPWSVGLLDAVTMEETARYISSDTNEQLTTPVEPRSNYLVGRVRRDFREGASVVGGIVTAVNRQMGSDGLFDSITPSSAYMAGLDFQHQFDERRWTVSGVLAASNVNGTTDLITRLQRAPQRYYQRPDSDGLSVDESLTSLTGLHSELSVARFESGTWDATLTGTLTTPGFEVNDLGFQFRADAASLNYFVGRRIPTPSPDWLQNQSYWHFGGWATNFDGDLINHYYGIGTYMQFSNQWWLNASARLIPFQYNDRLTRGGPLAQRPVDGGINFNLGTDNSKAISASIFGNYRRELPNDFDGAPAEYDRYFGLDVTFRPSDALSFTLDPTWGWEMDNDQFVTGVDDPVVASTFGRRYVFADIRQQSFNLGMRLDWTFTPELTLQLFAQPFVTTGQYSNYKEFREPGSFDFDVYGQARGSIAPVATCDGNTGSFFSVDPGDGGNAFCFSDRDFNFRSLRGNAVLRWEWRPGSTLFFVWQQQRTDFAQYDGFGIVEEIGEVFRAPVENVFLIKATYWLGL